MMGATTSSKTIPWSAAGENLVELVGLVAKRARTHGELDCVAFDAICSDNDAAVFAHFTIIAATTSDDNIDVCLLSSIFEIGRFPLERR